jgi:hypothetical protein
MAAWTATFSIGVRIEVMSHPKIYFYCCPEPDNLQDDIIILAEGLQALGIPYYANTNYWRQSLIQDDYLFRHTPEVRPEDCDIVVLPYTWFNWVNLRLSQPVRRSFPTDLFRPDRRYRTVYMDTNDGLRTVSWEAEFRKFDVIFRTKLNRRMWGPSNFHPWVLGLSNRVLQMTADAPLYSTRQPSILVNFGASHNYPHTTRLRAQEKFDPMIRDFFDLDPTRDDLSIPPTNPYDKLMWDQTNERHSRAYYERLKHSQAVSCFCGELIPPMPWKNPGALLLGGNKARLKREFFKLLSRFDPRPERSVQWDSWRFWEALSAGCLTFNLDLELYGAHLPVMPVNGVHYLGVNLDAPDVIFERWHDDPDGLADIAAAGQAWAWEHYAPAPMARRFLQTLGFSQSTNSLS